MFCRIDFMVVYHACCTSVEMIEKVSPSVLWLFDCREEHVLGLII